MDTQGVLVQHRVAVAVLRHSARWLRSANTSTTRFVSAGFQHVVAFFPCHGELMACAGWHDALGAQKLPYGFLTTYRHTFFIKRVASKRYAVTDAYLPTSTNPSVPEMLFCESVGRELGWGGWGRSKVRPRRAHAMWGAMPVG